MEVKLCNVDSCADVSCLLVKGADSWKGTDSALIPDDYDDLATNRLVQRLIKNAIYKAALKSGVEKPVWGAFTGVRPGKVLCRLLDEEKSKETALLRFVKEYDVSPERADLCMDTAGYTLRTKTELREKDVCLYVGIPFCPTRCSYCSFVSQSVEKSLDLIAPFLKALKREIYAVAKAVDSAGLRPVSVYFGGGTPTTLLPEQLDELFSELKLAFDLSAVREFSVEAGRPDTITYEKLDIMISLGVTRISVNPQTMSDSVLAAIGRKHSAEDILKAVEMVKKADAFQINMDLIAGLPLDTPENYENSLRTVTGLKPENITIHTLSLKKGSKIMREGTKIPSGEEVGHMLDFSAKHLKECGYGPYYLYRQKFMSGGFENTGWTKPGCENIYNICIMEELCSILAMGGGGSTKLVSPGNGRNIRIMNPKYPKEYIETIDCLCLEKERITEFFSKENYYGISAD